MDNLFEQMANISKAHAYDIVSKQRDELLEENKQLKEQVKVLEDALQPFANMFPELSENKVQQGGKVYEYNKASFTVADLFAAYNALHPLK